MVLSRVPQPPALPMAFLSEAECPFTPTHFAHAHVCLASRAEKEKLRGQALLSQLPDGRACPPSLRGPEPAYPELPIVILAGKGRARGGKLPSGAFLSHPAISSSFQKKGFLFDSQEARAGPRRA